MAVSTLYQLNTEYLKHIRGRHQAYLNCVLDQNGRELKGKLYDAFTIRKVLKRVYPRGRAFSKIITSEALRGQI
ncbi:hypothetical protein ACJVQT_22995 [Enterobacter huaxiensis]|uniref:hypothetical protein n=1 Tax=Enterobacter huaxiensis TaxID=2494702 RepID=UPI002176017E|nr:hypothetical protein [Enterobacter huaxiensis]MCS5452534.1 hypothetical protein [Enterobacter huaxiensis]